MCEKNEDADNFIEAKEPSEDSKTDVKDNKDFTKQTAKDSNDNPLHDEDSSESKNSTLANEDCKKISSHPDFLLIAQFITTFGSLLGIHHFYIDTIEDGLNVSTSEVEKDSYLNACGNAVEQLLVSLLRRCGVLTNIPKLGLTLQDYFEDRDMEIYEALSDKDCSFNCLSKTVKLNILKSVCLNQFDENSQFKTEFNSIYSPEDLRFQPLGRDLDGAQYWFISDNEKSHRMYRWKYPYSPEQWLLLSSSFVELHHVVQRLRPPENETQLRKSKLWEMVNVQKPETPVEQPVKKPRKKKKKEVAADDNVKDDDADLVHRIRKYELGMRKSARNVNRKVYTEHNDDNESSEEEEEEHKEHDEKYKKAVEIARSRKRSRKHLCISQRTQDIGTPLASNMHPKPDLSRNHSKPKEELSDFFINKKHSTNLNEVNDQKSKDPFEFCATRAVEKKTVVKSSEQARTDGIIMGNSKRAPTQHKSKEFLELAKELPSLLEIKKPAEAEDKCWKCKGEEDVDKMLFCDGCDLATYHMDCLSPPIKTVPDDDWFCPVCEQMLLFLHLRLKLDSLRIFTYVPRSNTPKSRSRKTPSAQRQNFRIGRPVQKSPQNNEVHFKHK